MSYLDIVSQEWKKGDGVDMLWKFPQNLVGSFTGDCSNKPWARVGRRSWAQCHWVGTIKYLLLGPARRGSAWAGLGIPFLSPSRVNIVRGCCRAQSRHLNYFTISPDNTALTLFQACKRSLMMFDYIVCYVAVCCTKCPWSEDLSFRSGVLKVV